MSRAVQFQKRRIYNEHATPKGVGSTRNSQRTINTALFRSDSVLIGMRILRFSIDLIIVGGLLFTGTSIHMAEIQDQKSSIPARQRVRELGIKVGILPTGELDALTD